MNMHVKPIEAEIEAKALETYLDFWLKAEPLINDAAAFIWPAEIVLGCEHFARSPDGSLDAKSVESAYRLVEQVRGAVFALREAWKVAEV